MIKILFFDFDGTIGDTYKLCCEGFYSVLGERGYKINKRIKNLLGYKLPEILKKLRVKSNIIKKIEEEFFEKLTEGVSRLEPCVSLKPLKSFSKEYKMFIISNSETFFIKTAVKKFKIEGCFRGIYGAERFSSKDKIMKKILRQKNVKPEEAVYIGDRPSDVEYAKRAGVIAVAIHNPCAWSSESQIEREKPDFLVKDFFELKKVLNNLNIKAQ